VPNSSAQRPNARRRGGGWRDICRLCRSVTDRNSTKTMFKAMIIAGLGGFIGTCLRFLTGKLAHILTASAFPWGTFAVNVVGSFVIGIFFGLAEKTHVVSPSMNVFLITGFCGGFTTFSSFADDMFLLLQQKHWLYFGLYVGLSFLLGLLLVWLGRSLVKAV